MNNKLLIVILVTALSILHKNAHTQQVNERRPAFNDVKSAKIVVSQSYGHADKINLPFKFTMEKLLKYAGIKVDTVNYDMIINIDVTGAALQASYFGQIGGGQYSGAYFNSSYKFIYKNGDMLMKQFKDEIYPPNSIGRSYGTPNHAPFDDLFRDSLSSMLMAVYEPLGIKPLIASLQDQDIFLRKAAMVALGNIKDTRAVEPLITALKDKDSYIRKAAAEALGNIKDIRCSEPLISILNDQNESFYVKEAVIKALGKINDIRSVEALITTFKYEHSDVQKAAAEALKNLKIVQDIEPLVSALMDEDVRSISKLVLIKIKDNRAIEPLISILNNKDDHLREIVVEILDTINPNWRNTETAKKYVSIFISEFLVQYYYPTELALNTIDPNWRNKETVKNSLPILISKLQDQDFNVRVSAINALTTITYKNFGENYKLWKKWWKKYG